MDEHPDRRDEARLTVYSSTRCADCRQAERWLREQGIPFLLVLIDRDEAAARRLEERTGKRGVPWFVLPDGRWVRAYIPGRGFDRRGMAELLGVGGDV